MHFYILNTAKSNASGSIHVNLDIIPQISKGVTDNKSFHVPPEHILCTTIMKIKGYA